MNANRYKSDFKLNAGSYLLNHSIGRCLKSTEESLHQTFFSAWEKDEPWNDWLGIIDNFRSALGALFNAPSEEFCPQTNLSSAITKIIMSLDILKQPGAAVLMSEIDFPTIGFALQHALPDSCQLRYIPKTLDITDANVWNEYLKTDVTMAVLTHAYSNTGQLAPLNDIVKRAKERGILPIIDVAQSAGIVPIDLDQLKPNFMVGSSVKWLCGGPGAAYLWVNAEQIEGCRPKDVGWFSHENPFEFNIHDFRYHPSSLRFWGGTPSVLPFAIAAQSISYFAEIGSAQLREHNQKLMDIVIAEFDKEITSPKIEAQRSGTMVLHFSDKQERILTELKKENVVVDARDLGMRVSPHIYNDVEDMEKFIRVVKRI